jgi:hypothetical protein
MTIEKMVDKILLGFFYRYEVKKFVLIRCKIYRFAIASYLRHTDRKNGMKSRKVTVAHCKVAPCSPASDMGNKVVRSIKG